MDYSYTDYFRLWHVKKTNASLGRDPSSHASRCGQQVKLKPKLDGPVTFLKLKVTSRVNKHNTVWPQDESISIWTVFQNRSD